ncbi:MAG: NAD-dependent epimerase/dehydratase family protein [Planctomycetes bacterium]|nr:NAD-dependent epimerase/dehydratase family protein [Planctomycetota bacterium]
MADAVHALRHDPTMPRPPLSAVEPLLRRTAGARAVVTGGAGFVGSHLGEELVRRGCSVHIVDDLSSGDRANLAALTGSPQVRCTFASVADPMVAHAICADADVVFHLAGTVGVQRLAAAPLEVMQRNLHCSEAMLAAAAAHGVPLLLASSSEVYGDGPVPFREQDPVRPGVTEGPRGGYACAKAMGEWLAFGHAARTGWPVVVARLFNTVGPRQSGRHGMVLPRFVAQALRGEPLTVYGSGEQTRCFAHVREVVRALVDLAAAPGAAGSVFNVGSELETSVAELAAIVRAAAGCEAPIVRLPLASVFPPGFGDPPRRRPCLDRLRRTIGWVPSMPLREIVAELLALGRAGERSVDSLRNVAN